MDNVELFQSLIDATDATIGVDSATDGSIGLFHILATAHDWCNAHGVDFNATLEEVRECIAQEQSDDETAAARTAVTS